MEDIDVPSFFICPISLEIMKDPVIVVTGITYDRESIEKWLFSGKNKTCPVTKQVISDGDLTPNHTLRRLIQGWCTLNASYGIERIPTPKPPITKSQISKLLLDAKCSQKQIACLRTLRSLASESDTNKRCIESAGAVEFLASIINDDHNDSDGDSVFEPTTAPSDEALSTLYALQISDSSLKTLLGKNGVFLESLTRVMKSGSYESRAYAVMLLKSMLQIADPIQVITLRSDLFAEIVQALRDQISHHATKTSLQILVHVCPWGRNRVKAVEAGAVAVLIDLLLEHSTERRISEMILVVLDLLCGCAEGRSELLHHAAGLAVVSKKILRVSTVGSERAVRILLSISKFSATAGVVQEMLQLGVAAKLCLVLQVECGSKTKEKAKEILKLHARAWKNSTCIPTNLQNSYPAQLNDSRCDCFSETRM